MLFDFLSVPAGSSIFMKLWRDTSVTLAACYYWFKVAFQSRLLGWVQVSWGLCSLHPAYWLILWGHVTALRRSHDSSSLKRIRRTTTFFEATRIPSMQHLYLQYCYYCLCFVCRLWMFTVPTIVLKFCEFQMGINCPHHTKNAPFSMTLERRYNRRRETN